MLYYCLQIITRPYFGIGVSTLLNVLAVVGGTCVYISLIIYHALLQISTFMMTYYIPMGSEERNEIESRGGEKRTASLVIFTLFLTISSLFSLYAVLLL